MFAVTITTKDKCRNCISDFDNNLMEYLLSKGVDLPTFWYKLEESKYTKWHCHGVYTEMWKTSKDDKFYVYFKKCEDIDKWMGYCSKDERKDDPSVKYLDDGVFLQE